MKSRTDKSGNLIFDGVTFVSYYTRDIPKELRNELDKEWYDIVLAFSKEAAKKLEPYQQPVSDHG